MESAGEGVLARVLEHPAPANFAHAGAWLAALFGTASPDRAEDLVQTLSQRFAERYGAVRMFHAGRPVDPESYLENGVRLASPERLIAEAREIFCGSPPRVSRRPLDELLSRQNFDLIDGLAGFHLDEYFLTECFTFYVLYGSHFLLGLAVQLESATCGNFRALLRRRGVPSVVACDVPLELLPENTVQQLCCFCIYEALSGPGRRPGAPGRTDFGFVLDRPLPPEHVVGCDHPRGLVDHL